MWTCESMSSNELNKDINSLLTQRAFHEQVFSEIDEMGVFRKHFHECFSAQVIPRSSNQVVSYIKG